MKKKKKIIFIIIIVILVIGLFILLWNNYRSKTDYISDLKIHYNDGKIINYHNFNKSFSKKRVITIENRGDKDYTYSLEWMEVKNTLKEQNKFLYEIKCSGDRCAELGKSGVPVASAKVYTQVLIEAHKKQTYTVTFTFTGSEKNAVFKGNLMIKPQTNEKLTEKTDNNKGWDYYKKRHKK